MKFKTKVKKAVEKGEKQAVSFVKEELKKPVLARRERLKEKAQLKQEYKKAKFEAKREYARAKMKGEVARMREKGREAGMRPPFVERAAAGIQTRVKGMVSGVAASGGGLGGQVEANKQAMKNLSDSFGWGDWGAGLETQAPSKKKSQTALEQDTGINFGAASQAVALPFSPSRAKEAVQATIVPVSLFESAPVKRGKKKKEEPFEFKFF